MIPKQHIFYLHFVLLALSMLSTESLMAATGKYRLTLRDNPSTSVVIGWAQVSGSSPKVHYGTTDYGTNYASYPNSRVPDRVVSHKAMSNNFVRLSGLLPNTAYYFVIRDSDGTSQRFWFKTAPNDPNVRLSFIAGGDSRNNAIPRRNANKLVAKLRPHGVFFGGDMTDKGYDSEWATWFDDWQLTIGTDGRMIPVIAARGNHESSNLDIVNLFDVPSADVYFALTFGGSLIRTYTLNSEISISGNQTTWLGNDLNANANVRWKSAQYHRPMRPHVAAKSEMESIKTYWEPLFYNHGVKLVVECDAHTVKSTYPIKASSATGSDEGFIRDDEKGVVYVGEGCWGAPLRTNDDNKNWTRNSGMFNQFNWIFVDQSKIEVRFVKVDNADNVGTVSDANIFAAPANLDVWSPSNGSVVTIYPNPTSTSGDVTTSSSISTGNDDVEESSSGSMYMSSTDIELVYDNSTTGNQTVGMRFNGLNIPQGSTIKSAYVQFTCDEATTGTTTLTIKGEASNSAPAFTTTSYNVSSRAKTSASVSWSPAGWSTIGQASTGERTPDLKNIVQEIVNRSGWTKSSSMALIITGTGRRTAEAYEGSSSQAPRITIVYSTASSTTVSSTINSGSNDAEEGVGGAVYANSSDIELVYDSYQSAGNQTVGLRFTNLNIPQGATIQSANIQFTCDETSTSSTSLTIAGENVDNSSAFTTSNYNISSRPRTTASVSWNPAGWSTVGEAGSNQKTPDLKSIAQALVNRNGWTTSSAMTFIITGSGARIAEAYEGSASQAAKLIIVYSTGSAARLANMSIDEPFESIQTLKVSCYPNLTDGVLNVELDNYYEHVNIELVDIASGKVFRPSFISTENRNFVINTSDLTSGLYTVTVRAGGKVASSKILVK